MSSPLEGGTVLPPQGDQGAMADIQAQIQAQAQAQAEAEQGLFLAEQRRAAGVELALRSFGDGIANHTTGTILERAEQFIAYIELGELPS